MTNFNQNEHNRLARLVSGNLTKDGRDNASHSQERLFKRLWQLLGNMTSPPPPQGHWLRLRAKIGRETDLVHVLLHKGMIARRHGSVGPALWRIAAGLVITFSTWWALQTFVFDKVTVITHNGESRSVVLPDSSVVELNAGSRLTYSENRRAVELDGEAFFQVRNGDDDFRVLTSNAKVVVLGTAFNVRNRGNETQVVVKNGLVSVASSGTGKEVSLQAGERGIVVGSDSPGAPEPVEVGRYLAWRQGRIVFVKMPLPEVFEELTRQFNVRFRFTSANLSGTITASYNRTQDIAEIVQAICTTMGWSYEKTTEGFRINNQQSGGTK